MKTQFGWHIIEAVGDVEAGDVDAGARRRQGADLARRCSSEKKNTRINEWIAELADGPLPADRLRGRLRAAAGSPRRPTGDDRARTDDRHRVARCAAGTGSAEALVDLQELAERLRRECPWDRAQTERTIVPHTVEEAYEVADAALAGDDAKLARRARRPPLPDRLPRAAARGARRRRSRRGRAGIHASSCAGTRTSSATASSRRRARSRAAGRS